MAYATVQEILDRMGHSEATSSVSLSNLEAVATAVSKAIEIRTGRVFEASTATRTFGVDRHTYELYLPDFTAVTTLKLDDDEDGVFEVTVDAADYELDTVHDETDWPYDTIRLLERCYPRYGRRRKRIEVNATWGWAAVPTPIREACIIMTARVVTRPKAPLGVQSFGEAGAAVIRSTDPDFANLIGPYIRPQVA